jgi:hypothetical protein
MPLFYNATFSGSCIIRILHTGCAKKIKKNSGAKRLRNAYKYGVQKNAALMAVNTVTYTL